MQNQRLSFAQSEPHCGLRFGAADHLPARDTSCPQRQSQLYIILRALKLLPICTPLSAGAVFLLSRLISGFDLISAAWSTGLLALASASVCAGISWACTRWHLDGERLTIRSGVLFRQETVFSSDSVLSADMVRTPLTRLMHASRITLRTAERKEHGCDTLLLSDSCAASLSAQLIPSSDGRRHGFTADKSALWLAAVSGEGLAAFYSAAAPIFTAFQDISGRFLETGIARLAHRRGIIIAAVTVFGGAWLLKTAYTRITHSGLTITRCGDTVTLRRGFVSRHTERLRLGQICALETRFSLPSVLFRRYSCSVLTPNGREYTLLPPSDRRRLGIETAAISPHGSRRCSVRTGQSAAAYSAARWAQCLLLLPLTSLLRRLMPQFSSTVPVIAAVAAVVLLWRAVMTAASAPHAGLDLFTDCVELTGIRRMSVRRLRVFRSSLGMIRITRNPLARLFGRCTVRVIPKGFRRRLVPKCIKLPYDRALAVCERMM